MKKNTLKAFTLVEMLIVIVIIGILIAALLPRMQAAQGRARDVARKTALSQIQSAIVTYQGDHGEWPGQNTSVGGGTGIAAIEKELISAGMTDVPKDPLNGTTFDGIGDDNVQNFGYVVTRRNSVQSGGFALMAKTEVAGGSNWVICSDGTGKITSTTDLKDIHPCSQIIETDKTDQCSNPSASNAVNICTGTLGQMRYIVLY